MAYTSTDIAALEAAIKEGVQRVKYADREVEYRSLTEMNRILNQMKKEVGITKSKRCIHPKISKGL